MCIHQKHQKEIKKVVNREYDKYALYSNIYYISRYY